MRLSLLALVVLTACGSDDPYTEAGGLYAGDYIPVADDWLQFGPTEAPADGPFLMIEVSATEWELRQGVGWTEADSEEKLATTTDDGLTLAGTTVLPGELSEGAEQGGATVLAMGDESVYYGTFALAARTTVPSGRFAGEWVFAPRIGPILMTIDGQVWELVYYE